jgi:hypothetical protein
MDENRAVCSTRQVPHDGGSGVRRVTVAESPGDPRPEKETEMIVVQRWVLAGRLSQRVRARWSKDRCPPWSLEYRLLEFLQGKGN